MDALYIFDSGKTMLEYKVRDSSPKIFGAIRAANTASGCIEVSSSQLVLYKKAYGVYLAVVFGSAYSPLQIENMLSVFMASLELFFGQIPSPTVLEANAAQILQILDVMLDDGHIVLSEPSLIVATLHGTPRGANIADIEYEEPVRPLGLSYTTEELLVDVVERFSLEVARKSSKSTGNRRFNTPRAVKSTVHGDINVLSRLSGNPRVTIDFQLDRRAHVFLHPAVDALQWQRQHILLFTPPDSRSTIASYTLDTDNNGLVSCEINTEIGTDKQEFEVRVNVAMDTVVKSIDHLVVSIHAPGAKTIKENRLTSGEITKDLKNVATFNWTFGESTPAGWEATLRGIAVDAPFPDYAQVSYSLMGKVPSRAVVKSVQVPIGQKKPYKGVRYETVGEMVVRAG